MKKTWDWFLERTRDYQNEPEHPLSNKEELFEYLQSISHLLKDKIILDVGNGRSKELSEFLFDNFDIKDYSGLDIVDYSNSWTIVGDMHDMDFVNETFDVLIYNNVLEHSISPYLALLEANRVLKSEGIIIVGLPIGSGHDVSESHFINLTRHQLQNLSTKTGFKLVEYKDVGTMCYYMLRK
ncbi:MAG: class I SAM-dependent methyltransferase [archaeon]|nr:class I SAM-dependent methyltransferase [archaeon]